MLRSKALKTNKQRCFLVVSSTRGKRTANGTQHRMKDRSHLPASESRSPGLGSHRAADRATSVANDVDIFTQHPTKPRGWRFTTEPLFFFLQSFQTPFISLKVFPLHPTCQNHAHAATQLVRKRQRANQTARWCL